MANTQTAAGTLRKLEGYINIKLCLTNFVGQKRLAFLPLKCFFIFFF